ncbi:hypothetical protein FGG79_02475 [Bacillus sp. BHET2]|uniref:DUF2268 domain-containing putative Zn-dependent protease n=1 Tax=Bacillus sp. BHET2 TaxID=2583818 RepID=UPI00110DEE6B|nr:DUF2268 domain-containing putative Zn-dependent protease [Bacillus sp. BHET2]TMU87026.1 hypothetical protein FGG79_02475 [Bacillus sp. BHET2]
MIIRIEAVNIIPRVSQMKRFIYELQEKGIVEREGLFTEVFQVSKEELDSLLFFGMFNIHANVHSLKVQIEELCTLDYEYFIYTELVSLQTKYPSSKPINFELFLLDETDEFVKGKLGGVSAFTDWNGRMCFIVEPHVKVRAALKSVIFHEYHHHWRMSQLSIAEEDETLLDRLVLEGLAEHFVRVELGEAFLGPYKDALSETDARMLWNTKYKQHIHEKGEATDSFMFGCEEMGLPFWGGYSLGYHLVGWYIDEHREQRIE